MQNDKPADGKFAVVNSEPKSWGKNTVLFADFNNPEHPLSAGNSELIGNINEYEIRRKKYNEAYSDYIGTIRSTSSDDGKSIKQFIIDYGVKNNTDYTYYLYPSISAEDEDAHLSPLLTKQVSIDSPYWSLFIVDESEEDNVYYLDKMFKFELNVDEGDLSNNAQVSVVQNFTKYPTIQFGTSNYWSGSLSSLCGFIASNDVDYIQTTNMINELKSITSDIRKKFLKDIDGNFWEIKISSPISISNENVGGRNLKTVSFSWVEVGSAEGISIIDNPNKSSYEWVITESGEAVPYMTYVWDEQYIWDNSYYWTSNEGVLDTKISNLSRDIKEGDK